MTHLVRSRPPTPCLLPPRRHHRSNSAMSSDLLIPFSLDSFDASTVDLIVEGNKYTVHRFFLDRDSPVLREMFKSPPATEGGAPSWTLSGVTKIEFEHLLWMYYNPWINTMRPPPFGEMSSSLPTCGEDGPGEIDSALEIPGYQTQHR
ncbi:hypothetical protein C8R46DRAFT_1081547 [Mycena filopes]|nr:hypothetical protein C8R46DRAFT_1081547 [Mycena filopes]